MRAECSATGRDIEGSPGVIAQPFQGQKFGSRRHRTVPLVALVSMLSAGRGAHAHGPRDLPSEDKSAPQAPDTNLGFSEEALSIHYQFTAATQYHPSFSAKYSGQNSMSPESESATAFVTTPFQFYAVRFLLGLAEAGFFPGIIVYMTHWFPSRDRARAQER